MIRFEYVSVIFIVTAIRDRQGDDFCCYLVAKLYLTLLWPWYCSLLGFSIHGVSQTRILEWVAISFSPGDLPNPGIKAVSPALAGGFLMVGIFFSSLTLFKKLFIEVLLMYNIMFQVIHNESESESGSVVSNSLRPHGLYSPWNSPGQNARVGSLSLLQGIFPTQGLNPGLLHCRRILYQLNYQRRPK